MKNIVLIGMMGCGKSTIGKRLAKELGMDFIDMDDHIEKGENMTISNIFEKHGEDHFRRLELTYSKELSSLENTVIACGGGIIKTKEAVRELSSGIIIFIDRDAREIFDGIDIEKRPLIKENPDVFFKIYEERYDTYVESAMHIVKNDDGIESAVERIKKIAKGMD